MTANERLRTLRKEHLHLYANEFAKPLGITGAQISLIETGKGRLSERLANAICDKYHVNYQWLMDGEDVPVFVEASSNVDDVCKEYGLNENEKFLLCFYLNNPAKRAYIIQELKLLAEGLKKDGD